MNKAFRHGAIALGVLCLIGCASAPPPRSERAGLTRRADQVLASMRQRNPHFARMADESYGYAVFPVVAEGAAIAGWTTGTGVVYERGQPIGYATLRQGSFGAQMGGHTYSQIILLQSEEAFNRLRSDNFDFGANAQATAITSGAANNAMFERGTAIFVDGESGLMAGLSINGGHIEFDPFQPRDDDLG